MEVETSSINQMRLYRIIRHIIRVDITSIC